MYCPKLTSLPSIMAWPVIEDRGFKDPILSVYESAGKDGSLPGMLSVRSTTVVIGGISATNTSGTTTPSSWCC